MFNKNDSLKAKGIAILLLLFHHLYRSETIIASHGIVCRFLSVKAISTFSTNARVCVWIFVFLTAYGLTEQFEALLPVANNTWKFI